MSNPITDFINFHKLNPVVQFSMVVCITILGIAGLILQQPLVAYIAIAAFAPTPVAIVFSLMYEMRKLLLVVK